MERLRYVERLDSARQRGDVALADEQAAVEQHPDRLDRVERDALGTLEDAKPQLVREPRNQPAEERAHRRGRQRLEMQRGEAALAGAPAGPFLRELGSRERQDEQRVAA